MHKTSYWIKLYHEILIDPKMGTLDNLTWRRTIELFLIAGDHNQAGSLPSTASIAWTLHTTQEDILAVLIALEELGIASRDEHDNWRITNFTRRQGAISGADRSHSFRNRREARDDDRYANRDGNETNHRAPIAQPGNETAPDIDPDSDQDSEKESVCVTHTSGQAYFARAFKTQPTPAQLLNLAQLEKTHGYSRLTQVIDWAVSSGIPPGRALRAISTAIPTWSDNPAPPRPAGRARRTGALDKLRKEHSDALKP